VFPCDGGEPYIVGGDEYFDKKREQEIHNEKIYREHGMAGRGSHGASLRHRGSLRERGTSLRNREVSTRDGIYQTPQQRNTVDPSSLRKFVNNVHTNNNEAGANKQGVTFNEYGQMVQRAEDEIVLPDGRIAKRVVQGASSGAKYSNLRKSNYLHQSNYFKTPGNDQSTRKYKGGYMASNAQPAVNVNPLKSSQYSRNSGVGYPNSLKGSHYYSSTHRQRTINPTGLTAQNSTLRAMNNGLNSPTANFGSNTGLRENRHISGAGVAINPIRNSGRHTYSGRAAYRSPTALNSSQYINNNSSRNITDSSRNIKTRNVNPLNISNYSRKAPNQVQTNNVYKRPNVHQNYHNSVRNYTQNGLKGHNYTQNPQKAYQNPQKIYQKNTQFSVQNSSKVKQSHILASSYNNRPQSRYTQGANHLQSGLNRGRTVVAENIGNRSINASKHNFVTNNARKIGYGRSGVSYASASMRATVGGSMRGIGVRNTVGGIRGSGGVGRSAYVR